MTNLTNNDYKFFEYLVSLSQDSMREFMTTILQRYYNKIETTKDYIIAEGNIPIGLVAHMDTVFSTQPTEVYYDKQKNVIWSPQGLGADDRAGIFLIIKILIDGYRPHIILTSDEEIGGIGAMALATVHKKIPFKTLKYLVQLDRRGINDCVFYECNNQKFIDHISNFGFIENWGTFSDISELCPAWQVCGTNLSVGYIDEHNKIERLFVNGFLATYKKLKDILSQKNIPNFKYESLSYGNFYDDYGYYHHGDFGYSSSILCNGCKRRINYESAIKIQKSKENSEYYCVDCFKNIKVNWCNSCGEPFEVHKGNIQQKNCYICNSHLTKAEKEKRYNDKYCF